MPRRSHFNVPEIPVCPFPKGKEAGIKCANAIRVGAGYICNQTGCVYHGLGEEVDKNE